jgi:homoserine dehydrogenase
MQKPLTLGVAGLGTVGSGLIQLLDHHKERLAEHGVALAQLDEANAVAL